MELESVVKMLPTQWKVWNAADSGAYDVICWIAGVGTGKTVWAAWRTLHECMKYPRNLGVVAAASNPQMRTSTIKTFHDIFDDLGVEYEYSEWKNTVTFKNGSWYKYQSLDIPPGQLKGSTLGFLIIDEVDTCPQEGVENLIQRVRRQDTGRTRILIGNSPPPKHWLEDAFVNKPDPRWKLFTASTYENYHLPADTIRSLEKMYPPGSPRHARYMLGKMGIAIEGAIYPEFDISRHVITPHEFQSVKPIGVINGLDLGANHPTAFLVCAIDANDVAYFCDEHYASRSLLSKHAESISAKYRGGAIFSDHDAQDRLELHHLGISTIPAIKDVSLGINLVRDRLVSDRLKIVGSMCPNLVREFGSYQWGRDESPIKVNDDAMDAMRYCIAGLDSATKRDLVMRRAVYGAMKGW